jgi:hypothetical protein
MGSGPVFVCLSVGQPLTLVSLCCGLIGCLSFMLIVLSPGYMCVCVCVSVCPSK